MRPDLAPEDELCFLLSRGQLSPDVREQALRLLASPLPWPLVLERARGYEILPLLYRNLQTLGFPGVPDPVRTELAYCFGVNAIRNGLYTKELARILAWLGEAGIRAMPLKGIALAESLYDDPALRICADMDVLVPTQNVIEAYHLLASFGYESEFTQPALLDLMRRYGKHCLLMRQERGYTYPLELHCGLLMGGPVERELLEEIWRDAGRQSFHGVGAFTLSADWEFLYLAVHAAKHGGRSLKWFLDLDRLCSRGMIAWERVSEKAQRLGWEGAVRSSLSACVSLFDTPVNPVFRPQPQPRGSRPPRPPDFQILTEILFCLKLLKTPGRKLRFLTFFLFVPSPSDCRFLPLPASLFFLYYPLRPLRLACRTLWWLVKGGLKSLHGSRA